MRRLSDTVARLAAARSATRAMPYAPGGSRLDDLTDFGSNPGALSGRCHVPADLPKGAPLVVVLHGCTQIAAGYDAGSGWTDLADAHGFALLFPEQVRANNPNLCFNWFQPADNQRDAGEALSIRQMIAAMIDRHALSDTHIFITGLSAGGAMAMTMLASYPEVFAGGAIIAGLPFGVAATVPEAFDRMRGHGLPGEAELGRVAATASDHAGPWPILSVWHGTADHTVAPANGDAIVAQWRTLHGLGSAPDRSDQVDGQTRDVWTTADKRPVIEYYRIAGLGHGTPIAATGIDAAGVPAPYMLEAGISSTHHIARFWGLMPAAAPVARAATPIGRPAAAASPRAARGPAAIIDEALRAAGLLR